MDTDILLAHFWFVAPLTRCTQWAYAELEAEILALGEQLRQCLVARLLRFAVHKSCVKQNMTWWPQANNPNVSPLVSGVHQRRIQWPFSLYKWTVQSTAPGVSVHRLHTPSWGMASKDMLDHPTKKQGLGLDMEECRGVASCSKVRGMDVICLLTIETMDTMTEVYNMYQKYFTTLLQTTNIQTKYIKNLPVLSLKLMPPATSSPKVVIMGSGKGIGPNSYSCGTSKPQWILKSNIMK